MVDFCTRNNLVTRFKKCPNKLYTLKSPGDIRRYRTGYVLVKNCFNGNVEDVKTMLRADINSEHNFLVAEIETGLKKI